MSGDRLGRARHHISSARLKKSLFNHSNALSEQLNFTELQPYFLIPDYRFLSDEELKQIDELPTDKVKANRLLYILQAKKPWPAIRKFLTCVFAEGEHSGHEDLSKLLRSVLPPEEYKKIWQLIRKHTARTNYQYVTGNRSASTMPQSSMTTDGFRPELPMTLIQYEGCLVRESYITLDRKLWDHFSNGRYDKLAVLTERIDISTKVQIDVKIIGRWFQSLISMHRDGNYERCLNDILQPALDMCSESKVQNRNILEGRICQRMAQIFLVMGRKEEAMNYFDRAKGLLQFVSRGYEKVNMFCREAKIMCATMPERRKEIEEMFCKALENVNEDDPFALASIPSIVLSKAAFHLKISFGSKPSNSDIEKILLPKIFPEDERKARDTLKHLPSTDILLTMRKCEHKLLYGELMRLSGKTEAAVHIFKAVVLESEAAKLDNIVANAQHRLQVIKSEEEWDHSIEEILEEEPTHPVDATTEST